MSSVWLTNSALVYEPKCGGRGELRGLSQWVRTVRVQLWTEAQINFGDLTPYLTYGLGFQGLVNSFSSRYTNILFASMELFTNFENAYWNPPQNFLRCGWSMFSSVEPSLAAVKMHQILLVTGGFRYDFTGSQDGFLYAFLGQKRSCSFSICFLSN